MAKFAGIQTEQSKRLGYWMDWDNSYYTNSDENNYTIWAFLAECQRRGLLYRGHDVMPWCPRCGTGISNMEAAEGYADVKHLSVTVRLPITSDGHEGEDLLVWTTTPWTLSSNVAAAVHPGLTYQLVEGRDGRRWWVSAGSKRAGGRGRGGRCARRRAPSSSDLTYAGPFDELPAAAGVVHRVIPWDEVSDAEGTGIVHIAPGCGQEDFALAKAYDLPVIDPIDQFGVFGEGFGWQTGRYAGATDDPAQDLARAVVEDLDRKGLLVAKESYPHSYPHCWRCGTQLDLPARRRVVHRHGPAPRADRRLDARRALAARGHRPHGARARLAPEHGRLDDQQEALLRPGAADLGVHRVRRLGGHRLEGRAA